jgi:tRNA-specific 2-thiouridylase
LELLAGLDDSKDQSYFLYNLRQKHLNHSLFPIGHLTKREVRTIAQSIDLPNASKKDSQGICFIGDVEIREFLRERVKNKIGNIVNRQGQVLGRHEGLAYYTIGQREGLGISEKIPHYVIDKRTKTNDLLVAPLGEESHFKNLVKAKKVNWVGIKPLVGTLVQARIRYRQPLFEAKITSVTGKSVKLSCPEPQRAVTQGQSVVLYNHQGSVIGGGVIY